MKVTIKLNFITIMKRLEIANVNFARKSKDAATIGNIKRNNFNFDIGVFIFYYLICLNILCNVYF